MPDPVDARAAAAAAGGMQPSTADPPHLLPPGDADGARADAAPPVESSSQTFEGRADAEKRRLEERARGLQRVARALRPLTRESAYLDREKLIPLVQRVQREETGVIVEHGEAGDPLRGARALVGEIEAWQAQREKERRRTLSSELERLCEVRDLPLRILALEPAIELRIPPLGVRIDATGGRASVLFARVELIACAAYPAAILKAHECALRSLRSSFDPSGFFESCQRAWRAARAAHEVHGVRVELADFLPHLALEMQSARFRCNPAVTTFRDYGPAHFAFDILRLTRLRCLSQGGRRLNLGVATGGSAADKRRVIYFEDEEGRGEYKLTIYFSRETASEPR